MKKLKAKIEEHFPFEHFRNNQKKILRDVSRALDSDKDVVIIEGPTGFGKSPVNIAFASYFKPSFYTTPQVKLVNQIAKDFGPDKLAIDGGKGSIIPLLGRKNYICRETNVESDICPIYEGRTTTKEEDEFGNSITVTKKCCEETNCTYWRQKEIALKSDVAIITFAMLITNSYLTGESQFPKRNLLIIDECHSLESQVAGMFAGFSISQRAFPKSVRKDLWNEVSKLIPKSKELELYLPLLKSLDSICSKYFPLCSNEREKEKLLNLLRKVDYMFSEINEGRVWIVNRIDEYSRQFKPIYIDKFLQRKVWYQANKIILSSATIPFRDNPKVWLQRLGLGKREFSFHSVPMEFPLLNRPIITSSIGGKMTNKEETLNWQENLETIKEILLSHKKERGVIHTHSYKRARKLNQDLVGFSTFLHNKQEVNGEVIEEWINSKKRILISPAVKEGVDLKDDLCRFQILLKVPYPSLSDARVKYLLMEKNQWTWYFNETAKDIVQMYGRAVRTPTDHAKFYIVDGSFNDICKKATFPKWFLEAIE